MARPRRDIPANRFSSTELAIGATLSPRTFALLKDAGIDPEPVEQGHGKSSRALYDSEGLEQAGVIGGFWAAGMPPFLATRLTRAFYKEWRSCGYTGLDKLSRLYVYWYQAAKDDSDFLSSLDSRDTFTLHRALRTRTSIYKPKTALSEDLIVEIVNRRYVFNLSRADGKLPTLSPIGGTVPASPAYRIISGWERGEEAVISNIGEEVPNWDFSEDPQSAAIYKRIEDEFLSAHKNAVGLLRVNVSLAVRNAFDAVHDRRQRGSRPRNWFVSVTHAPNRYIGVDDAGFPLDPNHPGNLNLSPLARAKRLVEIEEYIEDRDRSESE
jgi:hypothetical protein